MLLLDLAFVQSEEEPCFHVLFTCFDAGSQAFLGWGCFLCFGLSQHGLGGCSFVECAWFQTIFDGWEATTGGSHLGAGGWAGGWAHQPGAVQRQGSQGPHAGECGGRHHKCCRIPHYLSMCSLVESLNVCPAQSGITPLLCEINVTYSTKGEK